MKLKWQRHFCFPTLDSSVCPEVNQGTGVESNSAIEFTLFGGEAIGRANVSLVPDRTRGGFSDHPNVELGSILGSKQYVAPGPRTYKVPFVVQGIVHAAAYPGLYYIHVVLSVKGRELCRLYLTVSIKDQDLRPSVGSLSGAVAPLLNLPLSLGPTGAGATVLSLTVTRSDGIILADLGPLDANCDPYVFDTQGLLVVQNLLPPLQPGDVIFIQCSVRLVAGQITAVNLTYTVPPLPTSANTATINCTYTSTTDLTTSGTFVGLGMSAEGKIVIGAEASTGTVRTFRFDAGDSGIWEEDAQTLSAGMIPGFFFNYVAMNSTGDRVAVSRYTAGVDIYRRNCDIRAWELETTLPRAQGVGARLTPFAFNASGDVFVYGADNSGSAFVYRYDNTTETWAEEATLTHTYTQFGWASSVNAAGNIIAVTGYDPTPGSSGQVRIWRYNTSSMTWVPDAQVLTGFVGDKLGYQAKLNAAGDVLVVSGSGPSNEGVVIIWHYNSATMLWMQDARFVGADVFVFAQSIDVNAIGDIVAVGAFLDGGGVGAVRFYHYNSTTGIWGTNPAQNVTGGGIGFMVNLSASGTTLVAMSTGNFIRVFDANCP